MKHYILIGIVAFAVGAVGQFFLTGWGEILAEREENKKIAAFERCARESHCGPWASAEVPTDELFRQRQACFKACMQSAGWRIEW